MLVHIWGSADLHHKRLMWIGGIESFIPLYLLKNMNRLNINPMRPNKVDGRQPRR